MNKIKSIFVGLACLAAICASVPAAATVITLVDLVDANPDIAITQTPASPYTFVHDFVDNGFVVGVDQFLSASLSIRLTDTTSNENSLITVGGGQTAPGGNVNNNTVNDPSPAGSFVTLLLNAAALADLNADGKLSVTVSSTSNSFSFADSTLTTTVNRPTSVPEPFTLALMAFGFIGMSAARRRSSKK